MSTTTPEVNNPTADNTIDELKALIREAEQALGSAGNSDEIDDLRERLHEAIAHGESMISNLTDSLRQQAKRADGAIRANPYQTIGIAAGLGLVAGYLLSRRSRSND
jgi:ElaB/YqjD/DUF883 family membrane-anchored ribosome-binding protein